LAAALASRLARLLPGDLCISYFMSSGSEVVECALKLARAATRRGRFVAAENGYHGTTFGALSVTFSERTRAPFQPLLPACPTTPRPAHAAAPPGCRRVGGGHPQPIRPGAKKRAAPAGTLEPMQAEGGMNPPPPGSLPEVARLSRRYGALFVLDEIQTGLGRT